MPIPLLLAVAALADTARDATRPAVHAPARDTLAPLVTPRPAAVTPVRDTVLPRATDVSAGYERRLTVHRWGGYAMLPLVAVQYVLGERVLQQKTDIREGRRVEPIGHDLRIAHRLAAYGVAGVFGVNTVTGVWNLWEARGQPEGRALRTAPTLSRLAADAGFVISGVKGFDHQKHRNVAIGSMGVATLSGVMMYVAGRR